MKTLLYSFRTFTRIDDLRNFNARLFVFGKLKEDLPKFFDLVNNIDPAIIVGTAKSPNGISQFETKAVNVFNKTKKVSKIGLDGYELDCPSRGFESIRLSSNYTDSFCNYVMYKIAENATARQQFIHISEDDIGVLKDYFRYLNR